MSFGRRAAGIVRELGLRHVNTESPCWRLYPIITPPLLDYQTLATGAWKSAHGWSEVSIVRTATIVAAH